MLRRETKSCRLHNNDADEIMGMFSASKQRATRVFCHRECVPGRIVLCHILMRCPYVDSWCSLEKAAFESKTTCRLTSGTFEEGSTETTK